MRIGLYLSQTLLSRIAGAAAVLLALGLSLDLIRAADELVVQGGAPALAHYAALRAPAMAAQITPLAVLVGGVAAFMALGRRAELTVMRAAGQSVLRLLVKLAPLALALGVVQHLLVDHGAAWSERAIARAFAGLAETPAPEPGARVAGRVGSTVVIARLASRDGTELSPLTVYALDGDGQVTGRIEADAARFADGFWQLDGARRVGEMPGGATPWRLWQTALSPATVLALATGEAPVTAREAAAALSGVVVATRSTAYYATRIAQSNAAFAVPAVMLVYAAFSSFKGPRGSGGIGLAATGAVLGLGFVMLDGIFGSFGRLGMLPAWIAAWAPAALFGVIGLWTLLMKEE